MSNDPEEPDATGSRNYTPPTTGNTTIGIPGAPQATQELSHFNSIIATLTTNLQKLSQNAGSIGSNVGGMFKTIGAGAQWAGGMIGNIGQSMFGSANEKGWVKDFMMFPSRYMRSAVTDNRQLALTASGALGPQAFGAMTQTQYMMSALGGQFGNNRILGGNPGDLLNLMSIGSKVGAGMDWRYYANQANPNLGPTGQNAYSQANSPRSAGFLQGVYEAQRINPAAPVAELAATVGGYASNVSSQQQAAFLTGGAFSMVGAGNRQKPISEWASGILKWLSNLRPGAQRGTPFTYPELMSQNFPGSNIDAWLSANGVTEDMKTYFWSYALAASQRPGSAPDKIFSENAATTESVSFNRLKAQGAQTRTGFELAGQMSGAYANKEQSNQFFAELMGHMLNTILPTAMSSGLLSYMQYLPDAVEEIMMQLAERTNLGTIGAGVVGWGSAFPEFMGAGDVGDVGDYGSLGATSTAGMHPDARKRVDAMMAANPRLRMTSGYRDLGTQRRLKRAGVGRVSGRPSAHTRGMAADLGPKSEYPWIVANARKFGLRSGMHAGEPWHVGMGDVDVGQTENPLSSMLENIGSGQKLWDMSLMDSLGSMFSSMFGGITTLAPGQSPEEQAGGIANVISGLMKGIMGVFARGEVDRNRLMYRDTYGAMLKGANQAPGLPSGATSSPNWWSSLLQNIGWGAGGAGGAGTSGSGGTGPQGFAGAPGGVTGGTSLAAFFTQVLSELGAPVNQGNLNKLSAVTKFEGNGSDFNPFNYVSGPGTNANSVGVKNYPDWETGVDQTVKLLSSKTRHRPEMLGNLMTSGPYGGWVDATNAFYHSWGGPSLPNFSQGTLETFLNNPVHGAGDLEYAASGGGTAVRATTMNFHNAFTIQGGGAGGSIDTRRLVSVIADQLEDEMRRRMSRTN